jgi:hypothetical protein
MPAAIPKASRAASGRHRGAISSRQNPAAATAVVWLLGHRSGSASGPRWTDTVEASTTVVRFARTITAATSAPSRRPPTTSASASTAADSRIAGRGSPRCAPLEKS